MNSIILALGGIRSTIFCGLAIVFLLAAGVQTWRLGNAQDAYAAYQHKVVAATAKAAQAAATAREKALEAREAYLWKSGEAENAYQAGRDSAIHAQDVLVSDLRADRVRLQKQWRGCESDRVREGEGASGASEGSDDYADLRAESAGRAVRAADDADQQVMWLQSELMATRELYGRCMIPKEEK